MNEKFKGASLRKKIDNVKAISVIILLSGL